MFRRQKVMRIIGWKESKFAQKTRKREREKDKIARGVKNVM